MNAAPIEDQDMINSLIPDANPFIDLERFPDYFTVDKLKGTVGIIRETRKGLFCDDLKRILDTRRALQFTGAKNFVLALKSRKLDAEDIRRIGALNLDSKEDLDLLMILRQKYSLTLSTIKL